MTITITLIKDSCQKAENLGVIKYAPDGQGTSTLGFIHEISITGQSPLLITSSYDSVTGNISMAVFHGGKQYLMAMTHWGPVTPFFGVRIPEVGYIQIYFRSSNSN